MSLTKLYRVLAVVLAALLVASAANDYLELGWFGSRGKLVVSILLLLTCVLLAIAIRHGHSTRAHQE